MAAICYIPDWSLLKTSGHSVFPILTTTQLGTGEGNVFRRVCDSGEFSGGGGGEGRLPSGHASLTPPRSANAVLLFRGWGGRGYPDQVTVPHPQTGADLPYPKSDM